MHKLGMGLRYACIMSFLMFVDLFHVAGKCGMIFRIGFGSHEILRSEGLLERAVFFFFIGNRQISLKTQRHP